MFRSMFLALALVVAAPLVTPEVVTVGGTTAQAAELKFKIRSKYPYQVHLEFYGQKWNHAWPGNGKVYVLKDSKYHTYNLWCRRGDTICYGAWVTTDEDTYWGVGRGDTYGCKSCCYKCVDGNAGPITLSR
ncbi:MAG: hypothetical protein AAF557_13835 [Pseudomonadota bacterium]